jgi:hypothetical protein
MSVANFKVGDRVRLRKGQKPDYGRTYIITAAFSSCGTRFVNLEGYAGDWYAARFKRAPKLKTKRKAR